MKYSLIMENWRRYKKLEEGLFLLETKKITYESLLLKLENKEIAPMVYLESLDHYVTEQSKIYLTSINEGIFKDSITAMMRKAIGFAIGSVQKVTQMLSKIDVGAGVVAYKVIMKCLQIIKKLVPVAKKVMKVMGPFVGVAIIVGLAMCSQTAMAAGIDPETAKMTIPDELLKIAAEIAADLAQGMEGSEQVVIDVNELVKVEKDGEAVVDIAKKVLDVLGDDTGTDKAIRAAELLQYLADQKGEMSVQEFQQIVDKMDPEIADILEVSLQDAKAMQKADPEGAKEMAKLGKIYVSWKGHVASQIDSLQVQHTDKAGGVTDVSSIKSQSAQIGRSSINR